MQRTTYTRGRSPWPLLLLGFAACVQVLATAPICNSNDIRNFGASLGGGNDSPALSAADLSSKTTYIYADKFKASGRLTIGTSLTLNKPLVTGRFMSITVNAGKTLTLRSQPRFPRGRVLGGDGNVVFSGPGPFWVLPDWWMGSNSNTDANVALRKIITACGTTKCDVIMTASLQLSGQFAVPQNIRIWSSSGSKLAPHSSSKSGNGLVFGPGGDYTSGYGPMDLPNLSGFFGTAVQAIGTSNLQLYIPSLGASGTGVRFGTQGNARNIRGTTVEPFLVSTVRDTIVVDSRAGDSLSTSSAYTHFLVGVPTTAQSSGLKFLGGTPTLSSFVTTIMSVDPNIKNPTFNLITNKASGPISNAVIRAPAWAGFPAGSTFVSGVFNGLSALVKVAGSIKTKVLSSSGANNVYDWGGAWNRDAAVNMYAGRQKNPPASALITSNYASIKFAPALLTGSWPAGGTRTFYLNHVMATGGLKRILLGPGRVPTLAEFTINPGIVVHSIKDVGSYNLEVTLRNTLGRALTKKDLTLPSGSSYSLYFNLMIGVPGLGV